MKSRILMSAVLIIAVNCLLFTFFLISINRIRTLSDLSSMSTQTLAAWFEYRSAAKASLLERSSYRGTFEDAKRKRTVFAAQFSALADAGRSAGVGGRSVELLSSLASLWLHIEKSLARSDETFERMGTEGLLADLPPNSIDSALTDRDFPVSSKLQVLEYSRQLNEADLPSAQFDRLLNDLVGVLKTDTDSLILKRTISMAAIFVVINVFTFLFSYLFARRTDQTEKEAEKIKAQMLHMQKMESLGTLTGGIAHDFNNLLTVITGYSEVLLSRLGPDDPSYPELEEICKTGMRAAELTRQLLTLSSRQVLEPGKHDVNRIITDIRSLLNRIIGENIRMETDLFQKPIPIFADKGQIEQVLINLVINARDAMPGGGTLVIRTDTISVNEQTAKTIPGSHTGTFCRIAVEDSGTGIPAGNLHRIFDPFFTTKPRGKGSGLGLSVVYGIVERHKGWINVYSQEGAGSVFRIYLPIAPEAALPERERIPASPETPPTGHGEHVVLVEDDERVRRFAAKVLRSHGYTVTEVSTVEAAWEEIGGSGQKIDLVFSDMILEDGTGADLAARIKERTPAIPVLLASGYSELNLKNVDELSAGKLFLHKPYSPEKLLQAVHAALNTHQA